MINLTKTALAFTLLLTLAAWPTSATSERVAADEFVLVSDTSGQTCLSGVCFDNSIEIDGEKIPLRGVGTLRVWGFRVYTAAFYAPTGKNGINEMLDGETPRRLVLHYHRSIKREDIIESSEEFVKKNAKNNVDELRERLDKVYDQYVSVRSGDQYVVTYTPGKGTVIAFNGKENEAIQGEDFARAFFGIWLSEEPIDARFRDKLFGPESVS